jgi:hypothetical protein
MPGSYPTISQLSDVFLRKLYNMHTSSIALATLLLLGPQITEARQNVKGSLTAATPMSCRIEGKIVRTINPDKASAGPCAHYCCAALVKVMSVNNCGQSVTSPLSEGDTVTMRFEYTLHGTARLFPKMKAQYPGLKKGQTFTANAEQRLHMGGNPEYVVYGYTTK